MKYSIKLIFTVSLVVMVTVASCSPRQSSDCQPTVSRLLSKENLRTFIVRGFIVRYAMLISSDTRLIRHSLKGISSFTISFSENDMESRSIFTRINKGLKEKKYSSIMEVIESDSRIAVKALEEKGRIKEMVVLINDQSSFVCITMKGHIDPVSFLKFVETVTSGKKSKQV